MTCSTGALSLQFQRSHFGFFRPRTSVVRRMKSPAFCPQSKRSLNCSWRIGRSTNDASASVPLADSSRCHHQRLPRFARQRPRRRAYSGMRLTIAAAYGGREEIVDAVQRLLREQALQNKPLKEVIELVTPQAISKSLYAPDLPDPDLIIRTSGEIRLSGFLLWQSAFSEFYFTDVYWPAFRRIDFLRAVREFQQRQRRFGK